jgi:hypothetical protein
MTAVCHTEGLSDSEGVCDNSAVGMVVLGSYRSGTSVATRVVNLLGMPITHRSDLIPPGAANPTGFWESALMNRHNEWLLRQLGGSWCHPPDNERLEQLLERDEWLSTSRNLFRHVHRTGQWAWKEPRLCLTLPWWRRALPEIYVGILMLRHPLECATSSRESLGLDIDWALAIWERYMREALSGLVGLRVMVSTYESLRESPLLWGQRVLTMLTETRLQAPLYWRRNVGNFVRRDNHRPIGSLSSRMPIAISDLWALLNSLRGVHGAFPNVRLAPESSWTTEVLSRRHLMRTASRKVPQSLSDIIARSVPGT